MGYIQAEKVEFSYDGDEGESVKKVLRGISMEIQRGEFVALLGHNGSGKSTMAKMFNAMLLPSQGKVFIDGLDTVDEQVLYEIRRRVGLVLQNPDNQLVASVVEAVSYTHLETGMHTLGIAGALAMGVLLVSSCMRMWNVFRGRAKYGRRQR